MRQQILRQFFRHALSKCRDEYSLLPFCPLQYLFKEVIDLVFRRSDDDFGIEQPCRTDDLLHHDTLCLAQFVVCRSGGNVDCLVQHLIKLLEFQRSVVESGRQSEAVFHKILLAGTVASVHRTYLWNAHMALVHHEDEVFREEIKQAIGLLTGTSAVEIA